MLLVSNVGEFQLWRQCLSWQPYGQLTTPSVSIKINILYRSLLTTLYDSKGQCTMTSLYESNSALSGHSWISRNLCWKLPHYEYENSEPLITLHVIFKSDVFAFNVVIKFINHFGFFSFYSLETRQWSLVLKICPFNSSYMI